MISIASDFAWCVILDGDLDLRATEATHNLTLIRMLALDG